jgi:hypothetical protein
MGSSPRDVSVILAYGLGALPLSLLNSIWVTYTYPFFVGGPLRDSKLFLLAQSVFLLWNCVNDPLFGWLSDHTPLPLKHKLQSPDGTQTTASAAVVVAAHPCLRRVRHIRRAGYLLGAAFLFAWFPWSTSSRLWAALHFLLALCLYDGALTYLEVNHASLLADISVHPSTRAWCNSASSLFSMIGAACSFFAHMLYASSSSSSESVASSSLPSSSVDAAADGTSAGAGFGAPTDQFRLFCLVLVLLCVPAIEVSCRTIDHWARNPNPSSREGSNADADEDEEESSRHSNYEYQLHASPPPRDELEQGATGGAFSIAASEKQSLLTSSSSSASASASQIPKVSVISVRMAPFDASAAAASSSSAEKNGLSPSPPAPAAPMTLTFRVFVLQLLSHHNFRHFALLRLLQVFLCTFEKNHLAPFLDLLLGEHLSRSTRGALIALSFVAPHALLLTTTGLQQRLGGVYTIVRALFGAKMLAAAAGLALVTLLFGPKDFASSSISDSSSSSSSSSSPGSSSSTPSMLLPILLVLYLCGSRILTECVCRLLPLLTSSLVDEDRVLHARTRPGAGGRSMAASLIGTTSLLAKPGESLAPMLGWQILHMFAATPDASTTISSSSATAATAATLSPSSELGLGGGVGDSSSSSAAAVGAANKHTLLLLLLVLPLLTVGCQLALWSRFTLRGAYLRLVQQRVAEMEREGREEGDDEARRQQEQDDDAAPSSFAQQPPVASVQMQQQQQSARTRMHVTASHERDRQE